jgi:hypothetical protein
MGLHCNIGSQRNRGFVFWNGSFQLVGLHQADSQIAMPDRVCGKKLGGFLEERQRFLGTTRLVQGVAKVADTQGIARRDL